MEPKDEEQEAADTANYQLVSMSGSGIVVMNPPRGPMTTERALLFAAWLVALTGEGREGFLKVLDAVEGT